ncbi:hypothetical protein J1D01_10550 [Seonamhaeicola sp. NFXS20]|uniref:hypothetical protein n=1 Tax=Seonamhaeicola sp. NFXS20 TaxID=2816959 RepID=UPI003B8CB7ED
MNQLKRIDKLEEQIFIYRKSNRGSLPHLIVMHPDDYNIIEHLNPATTSGKRPLPYRGIEIFRSYDVAPGTFKIG